MDRNEVVLAGRLSDLPEEKRMPSGDTLTKWRLIVRRRPGRRRGKTVDTIQCATFDPAVAEVVAGLSKHDPLEVVGALRCRIWGPTAAKVWSYEVEVRAATALPLEVPADAQAPPDLADLTVPPPRPVAYLAAS